MQALVIYESDYGNTERIARAIAAELEEERVTVRVAAIREEPPVDPSDQLLIIGAPTQAHGIEVDMRHFIDRLPEESVTGLDVASFDTRLKWPKFLSGAASQGIAERLEHKGARILVEPESFIVEGKEGPLADGEEQRAKDWARYLLEVRAEQN